MNKEIKLLAGPLFGAAVGMIGTLAGLEHSASWCAAITTLCGVWWILEAIPLPATALVPFALFPFVGVLTHREVASAYGHTLILLMLAGSIISKAMEKSGAHRHLALGMVQLVGGKGGKGLVLGFLLASALLSMWISNTATALMLLPVALAVLESAENAEVLSIPLLLAVAYGASVGGSATPVGTPPNLILMEIYETASGREMSFAGWMKIGLPAVVVMLPIVWLWLTRRLGGRAGRVLLPDTGPWKPDQKRVLLIFSLTALGWVTRSAPHGGWSALLGATGYAGDSTIALGAVILLFIIPNGEGRGKRLLDWKSASEIPWGVFIMIGGGMAIGMAFQKSNLSADLGTLMAPLANWPKWSMILGLCLFATFLTEITSNTAVANILMPIMAAVGLAAGIDPILVMAPVTLGLNFAFMLPVATPPNAIIYGTGRIPSRIMMREGFILNLIGSVVITTLCYALLW